MKDRYTKPTAIEKALDILLAFTPNNPDMGTVELSQKTGFHTATVNRTLKALTGRRFLHQNPLTRKFTLGPAIFALGDAVLESVRGNLLPIALPHIRELSHNLREAVVLEVFLGMSGIIAYVEQGDHTLSIRADIGGRVPIHASAGAKAMLAFSEQEVIERVLKKKLKRFTARTITEPDRLRIHLRKIREDGVAFTREEMNLGVNAIGVPVFNHESRPVAAVVVVGPSSRVKCSKRSPMIALLKQATLRISADLLHPESIG
ncbi:MAG: IclR family transcriptional regulator [Thermodesulfobacteriota bacterium]